MEALRANYERLTKASYDERNRYAADAHDKLEALRAAARAAWAGEHGLTRCVDRRFGGITGSGVRLLHRLNEVAKGSPYSGNYFDHPEAWHSGDARRPVAITAHVYRERDDVEALPETDALRRAGYRVVAVDPSMSWYFPNRTTLIEVWADGSGEPAARAMFREWLETVQDRDDVLGFFAHTALADNAFPPVPEPERIAKHLHHHGMRRARANELGALIAYGYRGQFTRQQPLDMLFTICERWRA